MKDMENLPDPQSPLMENERGPPAGELDDSVFTSEAVFWQEEAIRDGFVYCELPDETRDLLKEEGETLGERERTRGTVEYRYNHRRHFLGEEAATRYLQRINTEARHERAIKRRAKFVLYANGLVLAVVSGAAGAVTTMLLM